MDLHGRSEADRAQRRPGDAKRSELIRGAAELFDTKGYHRTSMADIAAATGLQKPTLYHYFTSKEDLLFMIHEEFASQMLGRMQSRESIPMVGSQRLLEAMVDILEVIHSHRGYVRSFWDHVGELSPENQAKVHPMRARLQAHVEQIIQDCIDSGEFRPVDAHMAAFAVWGVTSWAMKWYQPGGRLKPRDIAYQFWDFFVHGFASDVAQRRASFTTLGHEA
jgi:AcrR family transcriptional regulator